MGDSYKKKLFYNEQILTNRYLQVIENIPLKIISLNKINKINVSIRVL